MNPPVSADDITPLDPFHADVVEQAMSIDRARASAGERRWLRVAVPHEFCPGTSCAYLDATLVEVVALAESVRIRRPIFASAAAA